MYCPQPGDALPRLKIHLDPAPAIGTLGERRVGLAGPALLKLEWEPTPACESYRLFIGDFSALRPMGGVVTGNASSLQCGIQTTSHGIPMPSGDVFFIVAGDNTAGTGPLGLVLPLPIPRNGA